ILILVPPAFDHLGRDGVPAVDHPYELELWRKARHRRLEELPQLTGRYRIVPGDPRRPRGEIGQQCGGIAGVEGLDVAADEIGVRGHRRSLLARGGVGSARVAPRQTKRPPTHRWTAASRSFANESAGA